MSSGAIIGIDPGLSGGISYLEGDGLRVTVLPMPTVGERVSGKVRQRIDLWRLAEIIRNMHSAGAQAAWVERVGSMPTDSPQTAFSFGWAAAAVSMGLACCKVRTFYVQPLVWKRTFKLSKDKDLSRLKASQLFPEDCHQWKNKTADGLAEAVLIARYGRSVMVTAGDIVA
jgi:hypothetical protein